MKRWRTMFAAWPLLLWPVTLLPAEPPATSRTAIFAVHCYDVGAESLEGLAGIHRIERGWQGPLEVNRIVYDPRRVSVRQMVERLQRSGTYAGTLAGADAPASEQEAPRR